MTGPGQGMAGHWLALVLLVLGALFLTRAAIIGDPGLHVPPIIAYVTAAVLLLGAVAVLQQLLGGGSRGHGVAVLILAGFTIIGGWIALSPESAGCTVGVDGSPGVTASGLACRIPFGIGALITGAMTVYAGRSWIRARKQQGSGPT